MNSKRKKVKVVGIGILIIIGIFLLGGWVLLHYKSWMAMKRISDVNEYAKKVDMYF